MCARCRQVKSAALGSRASRPWNPGTSWRRTAWSERKSEPADLLTEEVAMTSYRTDQVGEQVREEIMSIISRDPKDPRIGFVSITGVRMSPDLRQARVRV